MNNLIELGIKDKAIIGIMGLISFLCASVASLICLHSFANVLPILFIVLFVFVL